MLGSKKALRDFMLPVFPETSHMNFAQAHFARLTEYISAPGEGTGLRPSPRFPYLAASCLPPFGSPSLHPTDLAFKCHLVRDSSPDRYAESVTSPPQFPLSVVITWLDKNYLSVAFTAFPPPHSSLLAKEKPLLACSILPFLSSPKE